MFCQQCGAQIEDGVAFCTNCGAKQEVVPTPQPSEQPSGGYTQPQYTEPQPGFQQQGYQQANTYNWNGAEPGKKSVSFGEAIQLFFKNYANFSGRATKSEYWWAFLFNMIVSTAAGYIPVIGSIIAVVLWIPGLSVGIRRLHDTGKSWTYILMGLIPLAGFIILIVRYCKDSDGDNQWGPAPID